MSSPSVSVYSAAQAASATRYAGVKGKVALITGATRGIGLAIAIRLGISGCKVVICSRDQGNVSEAVKQLESLGIEAYGVPIHVGTTEQREKLVKAAVDKYGKIDILVSNVAVNPVFGPMIESTNEKSWDKIFDVNVKSHFFLIKQALPHMPKGGSILIISSYAGYNPSAVLGAYSVSKTALIAMTKVLSKELAGNDIRINCIAPGIIKTKFSEQLWKGDADTAELQLKDIPMGRFGDPDEIGGLAAFLCSSDASYITGETVVAAGGVMSRL